MSDSKGAQVDAGTMKAVRFHGKEDLRYEDLPTPTKPGKGMVKIKPAWCGICGTGESINETSLQKVATDVMARPPRVPWRTESLPNRSSPPHKRNGTLGVWP